MSRASLALGLCLFATTSLTSATSINTRYHMAGDREALPVQVFDDGRQLFVQIRDVRQVPIPLGANGPIDYSMKGHYMVLPLLPTIQLRWQGAIAYVRAEGHGGAVDPGGVVSMTRPVEAIDPPAPAHPVAHPAAPRYSQPAPVGFVPAPMQPPAPPAGFPQDVVGEIELAPGPGVAVTHRLRREALPAGANDREIDAALQDYTGTVVIAADGTVHGATAARRVHARCAAAKLTCHMAYTGAERGTVKIEES